jgi:hypothetical protein
MLTHMRLHVLATLASIVAIEAQQTVHTVYIAGNATSHLKLCACQRADGYLESATCFNELRALCESEGTLPRPSSLYGHYACIGCQVPTSVHIQRD